MRMRSAVMVAGLAAVGAGLTGCPSDSCPMESPQVSATPGSCIEVAGQPVSYPVRLCPTCNQAGATCVPDLSAAGTTRDIYLDIKVEACSSTSSCGGTACQLNATTCNFTAPTVPDTYRVIVFDGLTETTMTSDLVVVSPGTPESCALPTASL